MKILSNNIIKLVLYLSIVVLSCNKAKFAEQVPDQPPKSGDEKGEEDKGTEETVDQDAQFRHLSLSHCEGLKISNKELDISGEENSKVVIEGELCVAPKTQTIAQEMTVLFVLDFSGSMGSNDTIGANNSCGRQESISAIVAKLKDEGGDDLTKISMGIVGFNADATLVADFSSLDSLPQDWSQGACKNGGGTNYEAAFNMANDLLYIRTGHKVVYFISDGLPTQSSGGESQSDELGLSAAQSLREGNEELDLYAIYLGGETLNVGSAQGSDITDPKGYLSEITGDPLHVKTVNTASQLAGEIVKFELPEMTVTKFSNLAGYIVADGFLERKIEFSSFVPHDSKQNTWVFTSKPTELYFSAGKILDNKVVIQSLTQDQVLVEANALIRFSVFE